MSIDKLSSAANIIAALRAEMGSRGERLGKKGTESTPAPSTGHTRGDTKVLRKQLAEIVQAVSIQDPAAVKAVQPQMVRAILLWEFGPALREHPDWQPIMESITQTLGEHPPTQSQLLKLIADLKR